MAPQETNSGNRAASAAISAVRFEHARETLGLGTDRPRLSWIVETGKHNWHQAAYEIECYDAAGQPRGQTRRVESDQSVLVDWPFAPLASRERVTLRVRVWDSDGDVSAWSEPAVVEIALLVPDDWTARFITPDWTEDTSQAQPAPILRREFSVKAGLAQARLYITALGVYEAEINGAIVGDQVLAPGWTSYDDRLPYQTFDVTVLLREGPNALGATVGDGWFRGRLGFNGGRRNIYGDQAALLAQLELVYADATTERIVTDESWRAATGPIRSSDIYDGETYDARLERQGWSAPGYDDDDWTAVRPIDRDLATLTAQSSPPVRRTQEIAPIAITTSPHPEGIRHTLIDFGQNLVGRLRISVSGAAGETIMLRHAEVLENGELGTRPLRRAEATDRYVLRGDGVETWEPRFTFHGFRYAEVQGWPGELRPEDISAVVLHSDLERTGWFECSDPLINQLHENVVWSMRGNFLSIPTDCPQRDERLGWTGDIQVFAPTACFLYDSAGFLSSWLRDLAFDQQRLGGVVPFVVPNIIGSTPAAAAWSDAAVIVPWVLYQRYGDTGVLRDQFDSMRAWVDHVVELAGERRLWDKGFQFGDWLDPAAPPDRPGDARADKSIVATAYFARSAELLGLAASVLGRAAEEERYLGLAAEIRDAFAAEYVTPAGRLISDAPTAYALALAFALLPNAEQRRRAGARLAALVRDNAYRVSTGFVGTPLICDALCSAGEEYAAFRLLTERACPSWLYPVTMGATTIWERWDSLLPDGSINPGEMTSFNHYALGAVADWLHRTLGGLAPAAPGYRRLEMRPRPGAGISRAQTRHRTPYGIAECRWEITGAQLTVEVVVPPNTTASVLLPHDDTAPIEVGSGTHRWSTAYHEPRVERRPLSLDSTLGELVDEGVAWTRVQTIIDRHLPSLAHQLEAQIGQAGHSDMTLRVVLALRPPIQELYSDLEAELAALNQTVV